MTVKRVLVGWDGSPDAREAFRMGCSLADGLGAEVVVLEVVHQPFSTEVFDEGRRQLARHATELAEEVEEHGPGLGSRVTLHHVVIAADDTAKALRDYAAEHGFDLLVIGRHGVDAALHPRVGRVTERQVRESTCPVLVVAAR